jgi:hypothetical protein
VDPADLKAVARNNVSARLFNTNLVKEAHAAILQKIRDALATSGKNEKARASQKQAGAGTLATAAAASRKQKDGTMSLSGATDAVDYDSSWNGDGASESPGQEGTPNGTAHARLPSFEYDEDESSDSNAISRADDDDVGLYSEDGTETVSSVSEDGHGLQKGRSSQKQKKKRDARKNSTSAAPAPTTTSAKSIFLPSLMAAGYVSGSESSAEDLHEPPPRKNRRGQRARRQIWEKKYGRHANHVKAAVAGADTASGANASTMKGNAHGGGPRRRAGGQSARPNGGGPGAGKPSSRQALGGASHAPDKRRPLDPKASAAVDDKPLHPSWEAARQAKERKQTLAFQGKKITFD